MKVLLDTKVVLDLMLERDPWRMRPRRSRRPTQKCGIQSHVCAAAITDIFYISRKLVGPKRARVIVRACLDRLEVVSVTRELLDAAERRRGNDFEDDLQYRVRLAGPPSTPSSPATPRTSLVPPVPILTPAELLALLANAIDA